MLILVAVLYRYAGVGSSLILRDDANGKLKTTKDGVYGVNSRRDDFSLRIEGGSIDTKGEGAYGVGSSGANFTFDMSDGSITTDKVFSRGFYSTGTKLTFRMSDGSITAAKADAIHVELKGNADNTNGNQYEHLIEIGANARIISQGGHGIYIADTPSGTSRARLAIAGSISVSAKDGVGVLIEDTTGGVSEFDISGTIEASGAATTAIQNSGDLPLTIAVNNGARITGAGSGW